MKQELVDKIRSRGYWRINFQPTVYERKLTLGQCSEIVEKNSVQLRGWNYPHFPRRRGDDTNLEIGDSFYEGWIDWWNHIEFWRMYESGQFIHYMALPEDWGEKHPSGIPTKIEPMTVLGLIGSVIYQLTEIYEFLSRLAAAGIYDEGVQISISLNNTKGRELWIDDSRRGSLFDEYKTAAEKIEFTKEYAKEELMAKPKDLAFEAIMYVFDRFGWHRAPADTIKKDQEDLLGRRI
jgi:hypothetical protein